LPYVSLEDICRPGPVWLSPNRAGFGFGALESFDHVRRVGEEGKEEDVVELQGKEVELHEEEDVGDDAVIDKDVAGSAMGLKAPEKKEEMPSEFQSDVSPSLLVSESLSYNLSCSSESASSSPSTKKSRTCNLSSLLHTNNEFNGEWQCDYSGCGRVFQKRHCLK
jgi:hypothetical protein